MKYYLTREILNKSPIINISKEQFDSLNKARKVIDNSFYLEEKYELLIKSYFEWEQVIAKVNLHNMTYSMSGYEDFFEHRIELNLKLITLLTVARLYIKHIETHVKHLMEGHKVFLKEVLAQQYDNNIDYRFMDALRNYMQHREVPLHWITYSTSWKGEEKDKYLEFSIQLKADKNKLSADGNFKKSVLNEIPEKIDLNESASSFIESLSSVHQSIRDMIANNVKSARKLITEAHKNYRLEFKEGSLLSLAAYEKDESDFIINKIPLFLNWDEVSTNLMKKNRQLVNLKKRNTIKAPSK